MVFIKTDEIRTRVVFLLTSLEGHDKIYKTGLEDTFERRQDLERVQRNTTVVRMYFFAVKG